MTGVTLETIIGYNPVNAIASFFKMIETEIILHNQENNQRGTQPNGQSEHIYDGKYFVAPEIPDRHQKIIFKHDSRFMVGKYVISFNEYASADSQYKSAICIF